MSKTKEDKIQVVVVNNKGNRSSQVISKCSTYESFRSWKTNNRSKIAEAGDDIGPWIAQAAGRFTALVGEELLAEHGPGVKFSSPSSLMVFPVKGTQYRVFVKSTTDDAGNHTGWTLEKEEYTGDIAGVTTRSSGTTQLPTINLDGLFD